MHWMWYIVTGGLKDDSNKVYLLTQISIVSLVNIC